MSSKRFSKPISQPSEAASTPYESEEDSDFDVNAPAAPGKDLDESDLEPDDLDAVKRPRKRRKLSLPAAEEEEIEDDEADEHFSGAELDSGDEVTIQKAKEKIDKRRKRKGKSSKRRTGEEEDTSSDDFELDNDDEEGGDGGFVRTRGMKMKMKEERKPLARTAGATVDVDSIWKQMNRPSINQSHSALATNEKQNEDIIMADQDSTIARRKPPNLPKARRDVPQEEMINIKRTYKFAGEVITEEKTVPKNSAEAQVYLASLDAAKGKPDTETATAEPTVQLRKPLRRYSRFDPNPPDAIKKNWEKQITVDGLRGAAKGPKLNTVMKSKLDWAAYVDKEGIKDDLDVHSKAKEGYMGRMDFLNRVEDKREEERRNARLKKAGLS
ncbi:swr complex subunit [Myotisia sp. PD_48]|nr:swr complex subunit [Myotisia sp. PD_48]